MAVWTAGTSEAIDGSTSMKNGLLRPTTVVGNGGMGRSGAISSARTHASNAFSQCPFRTHTSARLRSGKWGEAYRLACIAFSSQGTASSSLPSSIR